MARKDQFGGSACNRTTDAAAKFIEQKIYCGNGFLGYEDACIGPVLKMLTDNEMI